MTNILRHVISYFFIAFSLIGCATKLQTEAAIGNAQSVMELLEKGESITETDFRGLTALHYAAKGGQEGIVDLLLTKGLKLMLEETGEKLPCMLPRIIVIDGLSGRC